MIAPKIQDNHSSKVLFREATRQNYCKTTLHPRLRVNFGDVDSNFKAVVNDLYKNSPERQTQLAACPIPANDPEYHRYHDNEWGVPVFDDQAFFEKICLEGFQSGLSWRTILHRREALRQAFDNFHAESIVKYGAPEIEQLLSNEAIIRNRRKIVSVINNANRYLELQAEGVSLADLCWKHKPTTNRPKKMTLNWLESHSCTLESTKLANLLKKRGWSFVGPTTLYALMQALGIVNDHVHNCPRRKQIDKLHRTLTNGQ